MVYPDGMAEVDGVQYLQECLFDQEVIANVVATFGYTRKEITFRAVFQDDIGAIYGIHDLDQRNHVGMMARVVMQLHLPLLKSSLSRIQSNFIQGLHCIWNPGMYVESFVHHSVGADT